MIAFDILLGYIASVFLLIATPGPVVMLVIRNASLYGFKSALFTSIGTNFASLILISISIAIIAGALNISESLLHIISIFGCLFICYLGGNSLFVNFKERRSKKKESIKTTQDSSNRKSQHKDTASICMPHNMIDSEKYNNTNHKPTSLMSHDTRDSKDTLITKINMPHSSTLSYDTYKSESISIKNFKYSTDSANTETPRILKKGYQEDIQENSNKYNPLENRDKHNDFLYLQNSPKIQDNKREKKEVSPIHSFIQGFGIAITNPKDILFFMAFFPQFLAISDSIILSFIILVGIWIVLDFSILIAYSIALQKMIFLHYKHIIAILSDCILIFVGLIGLCYNLLSIS